MIFLHITACLLMAAAAVCLLRLSPRQIAADFTRILSPPKSLRSQIQAVQNKRKRNKITAAFLVTQEALRECGKEKAFTVVCAASFFLGWGGAILAVLLDNLILLPILVIAMGGAPFLYAKSIRGYYDKHIEDELETALSVITASYIRSEDLITAVKENLEYIRPPVKGIFQGFLAQTTISADMTAAILSLKNRIKNEIFGEWCDCLLQCQRDRTMKEALQPIVSKLSDVHMTNNELRTMLAEPKKEYWTMVVLLIGNIPLLYMLNQDWFWTLVGTTAGKVVLAVCGLAILVTTILQMKYTKPIRFKR